MLKYIITVVAWFPSKPTSSLHLLVLHMHVNLLLGRIAEMEPGQDFWPLTRPDPIRSLSVVKQILDNGLIAVSVTCQDTQTV